MFNLVSSQSVVNHETRIEIEIGIGIEILGRKHDSKTKSFRRDAVVLLFPLPHC